MRRRLGEYQHCIDAIVPTKFVVGLYVYFSHRPASLLTVTHLLTHSCSRRLTPSKSFFDALLEPKIHTFTPGMVQRVTPKAFVDSEGLGLEGAIFVCATGFYIRLRPRFPVVTSCMNEQERWRKYLIDVVSVVFIVSARTSETDEVIGWSVVST